MYIYIYCYILNDLYVRFFVFVFNSNLSLFMKIFCDNFFFNQSSPFFFFNSFFLRIPQHGIIMFSQPRTLFAQFFSNRSLFCSLYSFRTGSSSLRFRIWCTNKILKASLFEFNFVLFKILQIKNIPSCHFESVHLRHEWAQPKSTGCKVVSFVINVAYFKHNAFCRGVIVKSYCLLWQKKQ